MLAWTEKLAQRLISGKITSICCSKSEYRELASYIQARGVGVKLYEGYSDVLIERDDIKDKPVVYPEATINGYKLLVIPNNLLIQLRISKGDLNYTYDLSSIFIQGAKGFGILLGREERIEGQSLISFLIEVEEFYRTYKGKQFVIQ